VRGLGEEKSEYAISRSNGHRLGSGPGSSSGYPHSTIDEDCASFKKFLD